MAIENGNEKNNLDQIDSFLKKMEGVVVVGPTSDKYSVPTSFSKDSFLVEFVKYGVIPTGEKRYTQGELNTLMRTLYDQIDGGDFNKLGESEACPYGYLRYSEVVGVQTTPAHESLLEFTEGSCSGDDHIGFGDGATTATIPERTAKLKRVIDVEFYLDTETADANF